MSPARNHFTHQATERKPAMNESANFLVQHGGPVLFGVVLVEQAGLPLPAMPWLLAAGALSASGKLNALLAVGLTTLACLVADSSWFYLGRHQGHRVLKFLCRISLAQDSCLERTQGFFK